VALKRLRNGLRAASAPPDHPEVLTTPSCPVNGMAATSHLAALRSVCDCSGFVQSQHTAVVRTDVIYDTNGVTKFREGNLLLENGVPACVICSEGASSARDGTEPEAKFTLGQVIGRTASRFPHQPAIVSATFAPLTYCGLQLQLDDVRRRLRLAGFDCNARIGVLMPNGPEAVLTVVAVACCSIAVPLGSTAVPGGV
jgi:hypothetical protein